MDLLLLSGVFVAVATATGVIGWYLTEPDPMRRRLSEVAGTTTRPTVQVSVVTEGPSRLARRLRSFVPRSPNDMNHIQKMMASAGFYGEWPSIVFATVQLVLPVIVALVILAVTRAATGLLFGVIGGSIAYYMPMLWLGRRIDQRRAEIRNGLPDAIDLLIVCLEAGSGLDQALARVAEELDLAYPALAKELEFIGSETRAGSARIEAFKNFAARTKVDDVRSLVTMLVQSDRFGTSLGQALRTHADTSRTKRRQRAEERAAKLGVKLLFPLVFCLFPAFFTVVLGPAMVQIYRQFVQELGSK